MRNSLRGVISVCLFVCLAALVAFAPAAAWGQSASTGTIVGVVTDNTNAVVPGATVTITHTGTGASRTTTTNEVGRYTFANVDPGTYDVKVSQQGFVTALLSNQTVSVGLLLTENFKLQVGAVSTTVTVTENPGAELQTLDATVGSTLSGATIMNLPNLSRDATTLAVLQPGQNILGNTGGVESDQNTFQLDGGFATDDMSGDNNTYIGSFSSDTAGGVGAMHTGGVNQAPSAVVPIPVTSVEEFKVSTANQTADFNGGAGSQMQIVTKRGTNAFHGGVYDYYLDSTFAGANTWDNNANGKQIVSSHYSRFGATAGGKIPHSNFAGGDWFIFGNYEGFRFPDATSFTRNFPTASLRAGLIKVNGEVVNLNPTPTLDPGTANTYAANGATCVAAAGCAGGTILQGAFIPCTGAGGCNARGLGLNPIVSTLWTTYLPLPNNANFGDGLNYEGFTAPMAIPESSNFGVVRIDHDFAKNEHFNATYHYYKLSNTVTNQWDIGGFFPGDTQGKYSAVRQKPQEPWIYTAGLTTDVSSNVTNDVHFSFTRNWWAYEGPGGPPNVAGMLGNLEIGGENANTIFGPYNSNNQNVRTRYWNGHDSMYRDDVTWIKGNHLFQMGGSYLRNVDAHKRNDNGQTINTFEQYILGDGNSTALSNFNINMSGYVPAGVTSTKKYGNLYTAVLGMVDQTQVMYTRGLGTLLGGLPLQPRSLGNCASANPATADCTNSPSLLNTSVLPTYNVYLTDSWHMKPTISLNYGLGYALEMPPFETGGGFQSVMVDSTGSMLRVADYFNNVKTSALQGIGYAAPFGFSAIRNVPGHSKYPYDPYYAGLSPRIGIAWNVRPDTVLRAGFSRIYGRINGVDPILVPMLTPGLLQPATCTGPTNTGSCGTAASLTTPLTGFRVGADCVGFSVANPCAAPLPAPSANLPQPWYPGLNDVGVGSAETIDPNFHPNHSDEFTFTVQHQFGPKILVETGYIGRLLKNEVQYYSMTQVPYMMTQGGQTFAQAWRNIMVQTNFGTTNLTACGGAVTTNCFNSQPFFEAGITGGAGGGYCGAFANCTDAFIQNNSNNGSGLMLASDPFDAWASVSNNNTTCGAESCFNFGRSFTSDPFQGTCPVGAVVGLGCGGQSPSMITEITNGYGNYHSGYLQLTTTDWHGLTMKSNFSMSKALGTGNVVQASSSVASLDPWDLSKNYGLQSYDEKFVFNFFFNYAEPFYASQKGVVGKLLGGWNVAPLFVWGSAFPVELNTGNGNCGTFGECNTSDAAAFENDVITKNIHYSPSRHQGVVGDAATGCGTAGPGQNAFGSTAAIDASCPANFGIFGDPVRNPVLGLDSQIGGGGVVRGLPFYNLNVGFSKNIKIMEKLSGTMHFDFVNVLNHVVANDPFFYTGDPSTWGVLGAGFGGAGSIQGNNPRELQFGVTLDW